jgi:hypothetical protein
MWVKHGGAAFDFSSRAKKKKFQYNKKLPVESLDEKPIETSQVFLTVRPVVMIALIDCLVSQPNL